jgi:cytochrome c553
MRSEHGVGNDVSILNNHLPGRWLFNVEPDQYSMVVLNGASGVIRHKGKRMKPFCALMWMASLAIASCLASAEESTADTDQVRRAAHVCAACHGEGGNSTVAMFPKLAGQQAAYTIAQLSAFRTQKRAEQDAQAYMWGISALLDDAAIQGLAEYFASQAPTPGKTGDARLIRKGKQIYLEGIPSKGVRACRSCHGDDAEGASVFPRLAGQHAAYVLKQLKVFGTRLRPHGIVMTGVTKNMTPAEMRAVAEYVQSK